MLTKKYILGGCVFIVLAGTFSASYAQPGKQEMAKLIQKMDMLDSLDFQDAIAAANSCTTKREFSCSERELKKAEQLATNSERKQMLTLAKATLEGEQELASLEKEQKALEEKIRREGIAEQNRQREWQAEQERRQRLAEKRAREQKEKQQAIALGLGLLASAAAVAQGADAELGSQVMEQTYSGSYAAMSGDQKAARQYQRQKAAMEKNLESFQARQKVARQQQAERQRQHEEMIRRHEENMRVSKNRPTVKPVQNTATKQSSQPALAKNTAATVQNLAQQRAAENARQERLREKQAYEAQKMAKVEAARQKMAVQGGARSPNTVPQQSAGNQKASESLILAYAGSKSGSDNLLQPIGGNKFKLARYEPAGNGYVWENILLKGEFKAMPHLHTTSKDDVLVWARLALENPSDHAAGYKYQGLIYPYQLEPYLYGERRPWRRPTLYISGDLYLNEKKVTSFRCTDHNACISSALKVVAEVEVAKTTDIQRAFEFRNLRVLPQEELPGVHKNIQYLLDHGAEIKAGYDKSR